MGRPALTRERIMLEETPRAALESTATRPSPQRAAACSMARGSSPGRGATARPGELEDRRRLVPGAELQQGVGAADEDERTVAMTPGELGQGIARETQSELDLGLGDGEALVALDRQARHLEAHGGRHVAGDVLVGRGCRRHEEHALEAELGAGVRGDREVCDVRRVEASAEHPDGPLLRHAATPCQARTCPSPQATYFRQVSSRNEIGPRTWSFCVEMPISAPRPNWPPSVNRVEAFT